MKIEIDGTLREIAEKIVAEGKSADEWAAIESDDLFQEGRYEGGFDADEGEFCFSYYGEEGEAWFQFSLELAHAIAAGETPEIEGREAE